MRPDPSGQVASFLASNRSFVVADLWGFRTVYGEYLSFSGYTIPFTLGPSLFDQHSIWSGSPTPVVFGLGPRFGRTKTAVKVGLAVETLDLAVYAGPSDSVGGLSWQAAFFNGVFDLATVELGRLVCSTTPGAGITGIVGYVVWFQGLVGDVEVGRTTIAVKVNSTTTLMTAQYPRRVWQHTCSHVFGDAMCQFDRQSMAVTVQAQAPVMAQTTITTGFNPNPSNLYDLGTIVGLSGGNAGIKRTVSNAEGGVVNFTAPFIYTIQPGDYFSLLPGCDHTLSACQNYFNNLGHFGGQPYIPQSEFAIALLAAAWLGSFLQHFGSTIFHSIGSSLGLC